MLTRKALEEFGANVNEGMRRCLNREDTYLRLVGQAVAATDLDALKNALEAEDFQQAFALCHAMKGLFGNLALTPLYELTGEMTEHLRARDPVDYGALFASLRENMDALEALCR